MSPLQWKKAAKIGAVVAIAAGLAVVLWTWREEVASAARQAVISEELRQELREAEERAEQERRRRKAVESLAEELEGRAYELRSQLEALDRAEEESDEVEEWGSSRVPDDVRRRLREPGTGSAAGDGD